MNLFFSIPFITRSFSPFFSSLVTLTKKGNKSNKGGNVEPTVSYSSGSNGNGIMHSDSLRLTDDDRVSAFVIYASLLSRGRRLKEANKILAEAKVNKY